MARQRSLSLSLVLSGLFGAQLACVGTIGDGQAGGRPGGSRPGDPSNPSDPANPANPFNPTNPTNPSNPTNPTNPTPPGPGAGDPNAAGPRPLRRLDRREYNNTVRDLLGDTSNPADRFPSDRDTDFLFRHTGPVTSQDYSTLQEAAEALAAGAKVATLAPCAGGAEEACARTFATSFGLRAYRRPLVDREVDSLLQLYRETRANPMVDYAGGIRAMIEGILQSPAFLYHWESGPSAPLMEGALVRSGPYENASQLSYFIWGSMPDAALFDAAAGNKLGTQAELETQARRMIADPKARETVAAFVEEWLGLDSIAERAKDPKVYPEYKDELKTAMMAEARAFASNVAFDGDGRLATLLTAGFSMVNQPLAAIYGIPGVTGMDLKQSNFDAAQRSGLLTQAAFLSVTGAVDGSNPVKRGHKVYTRLLCGQLPDPPADVPQPKPASLGGTTRQRFAEHDMNECAKGCHALIDPIGFGFEHYDGIGRYRTMDNGGMVDSSGTVELDGKKSTFADARDITQVLAASDTVRRCFTTMWARFAFRRLETDGDRGSLEAMLAAFSKDGFKIRDLMVGVAGSRSFRYRAPAQGEILK
jgi:hypothetical protein